MDEIFDAYNIALNRVQKDKLKRFFLFLKEENAKYNLTALTEERDVYCKHFADSLLIVDMLKSGKLLDVGSGGGMPAIPLAVAREDISFTLLEATGKKCAFLRAAASLLDLKNVTVLQGRAEENAKGALRDNPKEHIDNTEEGSGASGQEGKVAFSPLSSLHSASVAARRGEKNRK